VDTAFFLLSKMAWFVISPETVLILLVVTSWILLLRGATKWAKRLLGLVAVTMLVLSFLPVGEWVLYPLEMRFPANPPLPREIDGIVVLGGGEDPVRSGFWQQAEVNDSAERFLASIMLARRYPTAKVVFSSGSGSVLDQDHKSTDVARMLYQQQGLDLARIIFESGSRNTAENVSLSKRLVKPGRGESWVLVTSAFHMPRSIGIFCKAGWSVIAFPVDHKTLPGHMLRMDAGLLGNLANLSTGIKEWIGLAAYYLTGKTTAPFPAGCP
jgi:uncharacterized SAM-binding protein YcdF (DUF218 family)